MSIGHITATTEKVEIFGKLVFHMEYLKRKEKDGTTSFVLFLKCKPKNQLEMTSDTSNTGWGTFIVEADIEIIKSYNESESRRVAGKYHIDSNNVGVSINMDTLLDPGNQYLTNNQLNVSTKIYSVIPWKASNEQLQILNESNIQKSLWEAYFDSGIGADVSLVAVDGTSVRAHSGVLMAASPVFKAMFETPMEESRKREIQLSDMATYHSVETLLKCIYTGSFCHLYTIPLRVLKEIINAAEKYHLDTLKNGAATFLPGYVCPSNAVHLLHFAMQYRLLDTEQVIRKYIKRNVDSVVDNTMPQYLE